MRKVDPVRHEQKRREILQAALACFVRDGFHGASTTDICAEAGISPGHLYHYFPSKETMIQALVEQNLEHAGGRLQAILAGPDVIEALVQELESTSIHQPQAQVLTAEALAEACRNPEFASIVHAHARAMRALLVDFIVKAQHRGEVDASLDPEATANILFAVVDGARALPIRNPIVDVKQCTQHLRLLLTRFLKPAAAAAVKPVAAPAVD
ncbi:putative transcriptional regulatory protein, TetR/AcrR family [Bradyrhizobium sp. ORS 375]|uniref:TetR/AcrR family transcriptional regulator n=1 Tax=Bradyrhizobium sp. (strain ORS 375) TaxID=566679 RepID=UPI0002407FA7|nr:TetR/AcrR family transcriptional regulator [Bradyrhizobium sp. ORS 375]CCD91438.1 putative transcriptional regulatory protein, TetR/AcrR family [Bradyrhizobium sp. ORS 375]